MSISLAGLLKQLLGRSHLHLFMCYSVLMVFINISASINLVKSIK